MMAIRENTSSNRLVDQVLYTAARHMQASEWTREVLVDHFRDVCNDGVVEVDLGREQLAAVVRAFDWYSTRRPVATVVRVDERDYTSRVELLEPTPQPHLAVVRRQETTDGP